MKNIYMIKKTRLKPNISSNFIKKTILLLFIALAACSSPSQMNLQNKAGEQNHLEYFQSEFINENIPYKLILPENFISKKDSLSLLVLLDGDNYSGLAENVTSLYEFGNKIYPTVILSLPSTQESRWTYYTPTKDTTNVEEGFEYLYEKTGGFPKFADFLSKELIPSIENKYAIKFRRKTIFGHSLGGLGVLSFAVLRPDIFENYISASPSTMYDQHFIFETIEEKGQLEFNSIFLTVALNDMNGYRENVEWLKNYLDTHKLPNQTIEMKIYQNEEHSTSGLKSLIDGLEFIGKK